MFANFMEQNARWLAPVALGLGVLIIVAYFLVIRSLKTERCAKCRAVNVLGANVCAECGSPLPLPKIYLWNLLLVPVFILGGFVPVVALAGLAHINRFSLNYILYGLGGLLLMIAPFVLATFDRTRRTFLKKRSLLLKNDFYGGFCSACGKEILGGMKSCPTCGQPVDIQAPNWTARPKQGGMAAQAELKVICRRCGSENPASSERCIQCSHDLLSYKPVWERLAYLVVALLISAGSGWLVVKGLQNPTLFQVLSVFGIGIIGLGLVTIALPFIGLKMALGTGAMHDLLADRAGRHQGKYPWQALSDLSHALLVGPVDKHTDLLKKRVELYRLLGLEQNATRDELALTYAREKNPQGGVGLFLGEKVASLAGPTRGFAEGYLGAVVKEARSQREAMFLTGRVIAAAWCPVCKEIVVLKDRLICPHSGEAGAKPHPRELKLIQYVVPPDLEAGKTVIPKLIKAERMKRIRSAWGVAALVLVCLVLVFVLPPLLD